MNIKKIFENNQNWVNSKLELDPAYFKTLSEGQNPEILYIGCSDSRVSPTDIMGIQPGEAFIHRNIANLVPDNDINSKSVINYAVNHLKVSHIIVCGHYNCGGVKAAMSTADMGPLNHWINNIRDIYKVHEKELDDIENSTEKYNKLVELNVQEQCVNILKMTDVQKAYNKGKLKVHGWVFDIYHGTIIDLKN